MQHIKPVRSAIAASPYSLNPAPSARSPLELDVPLPAPTQDSRREEQAAAAKLTERAVANVRDARAVRKKQIADLFTRQLLGPDSRHKAEDMMEKVVRNANTEVNNIGNAAKKALQG